MKHLGGTFSAMSTLIFGWVTLLLAWPGFLDFWRGASVPVTAFSLATGLMLDFVRAKRRDYR